MVIGLEPHACSFDKKRIWLRSLRFWYVGEEVLINYGSQKNFKKKQTWQTDLHFDQDIFWRLLGPDNTQIDWSRKFFPKQKVWPLSNIHILMKSVLHSNYKKRVWKYLNLQVVLHIGLLLQQCSQIRIQWVIYVTAQTLFCTLLCPGLDQGSRRSLEVLFCLLRNHSAIWDSRFEARDEVSALISHHCPLGTSVICTVVSV